MIDSQNRVNSPLKPVLLDKVPICQQEGCRGHCVAVYHNLDLGSQPAGNPIAWIRGKKRIGIRVYSGMCWKHQKWDVFKAAKFDIYASGQIPLHSKLRVL